MDEVATEQVTNVAGQSSTVTNEVALPRPSRSKAVVFTILVLLSVVINAACGIMSYSLYSGGAILQQIYDYLANHDLSFFVWVAAGVGLLGTVFTIAAYALSFDYRRTGRPIVRLWLLFTSFAVFLSGLLLGAASVQPENVPAILGAGVACLAFPLPILLIERALGRGALRSALRFLESNSPTSARASARTALVLLPGQPACLIAYGLALSAAGRHEQALPYLLYAEQHEDVLSTRTALALADAWETVGNPQKTIHYLDNVPAEAAPPGLLARQVRLWLDNDQHERARAAIAGMSPTDRRPWREEYLQLLVVNRDRDALRALCSEVHADDEPPYERSVGCLKQLLALFPSDIQALLELVNIQKELKNGEAVAALQEEVLRLDEDQAEIRRELVNYYWERGHRADLLRHLNRLLLSGGATTAEKLRLLEETYSEGDFLRVEELVAQEVDLGNNPRALFILASTLTDAGREDDALERLAQAKRIASDDKLLKKIESLHARIRKDQVNKGIVELQQRVALSPGDLDVKFDYLDHLVAARQADRVVVELDDMLHVQPGLLDRVEKEIRVMLSRHGKNRRLMDFLGDIYLRNREYDKAFDLYERRAQGEMDAPEILHAAAQKILELNPHHAPSLQAEMRYYHGTGRGQEALAALDQISESNRPADKAETLRIELDAAEQAGNLQRAIAAGTALLEHTPKDAALMARIARIHIQQEDYDAAISLLQSATELEPDDIQLRRQLRSAVEQKKQRRMAAIKTELAAHPGNRDLMEELGDLYHDFDQLNDAITWYQKAGLNDPERRVPRAKLGYLLARKGLFTDADESLQEADLNPSLSEEEQEKLKNLFFITAQLMEEESETERALNLYRRIFRVDAGYRDVVTHVERLQVSEKKRKS